MIKGYAKPILARLDTQRAILLWLCEVYRDCIFHRYWSTKELRGLLCQIKKIEHKNRSLERYMSFM
jgi:hypothetical protein